MCLVPLCQELLLGRTKSCHDIWHKEADLATECRLDTERLLRIRDTNRKKRAREEGGGEEREEEPAVPHYDFTLDNFLHT